jgi:hypothetical protein
MRRALRLALLLALVVPGFALLGALAAHDNGERMPWLGLATGAATAAISATCCRCCCWPSMRRATAAA